MSAFTVNGRLPDFAACYFALTGDEIEGITDFSWKVSAKGSKKYGSSRRPKHKTRGTAEYEASIKMPSAYASALRRKLGNDYMGKDLNLLIVYGKNGEAPTKIEIIEANIEEDGGSGSEGSADALEEEITLNPMRIKVDGLDPVA